MKLWARTTLGEKITRNFLFPLPGRLDILQLPDYLTAICGELDIPRPMILNKHFRQLNKFNHVVFKPDCFIESVDFDRFTVEIAVDSTKKTTDFYGNL